MFLLVVLHLIARSINFIRPSVNRIKLGGRVVRLGGQRCALPGKGAEGKHRAGTLHPAEQGGVVLVGQGQAAAAPGIGTADALALVEEQQAALRPVVQAHVDEAGKALAAQPEDQVRQRNLAGFEGGPAPLDPGRPRVRGPGGGRRGPLRAGSLHPLGVRFGGRAAAGTGGAVLCPGSSAV